MNSHHIVSILPVAHLNMWGVANIPNGNVTANIQQAFGNAQGARGANFLNASMWFDPAAHTTIVTNRNELASILPRIIPSCLLVTRPTRWRWERTKRIVTLTDSSR